MMSTKSREVKNKKNPLGGRTNRPGTVFDVSIKYTEDGKRKTHTKRGFLTTEEALAYEKEMKLKFSEPDYLHRTAKQTKQPLSQFLAQWLEEKEAFGWRTSTYQNYRSCINAHVIPALGDIPLNQVTNAVLDDFYLTMLEQGCSDATVQGVRTALSSAFQYAYRHEYIPRNVARNSNVSLVRNKPEFTTYTTEQLGLLLSSGPSTMYYVLTALYGLRNNEALGLRWRDVDWSNRTIHVTKQLPTNLTKKDKLIKKMAPVKAGPRTLPITPQTFCVFTRQDGVRQMLEWDRPEFYDNDLVIRQPDGSPYLSDQMRQGHYQLITKLGLPHTRIHDLRRSAATNMHDLTGDFFTVSQILGHSISATADMLGLATGMQSVTDQYISKNTNRMGQVLERYHPEGTFIYV